MCRRRDGRRCWTLDEFERSGTSGAKFARLAGIKYPTFANWVQQRGKRQTQMKPARGEAPQGTGLAGRLVPSACWRRWWKAGHLEIGKGWSSSCRPGAGWWSLESTVYAEVKRKQASRTTFEQMLRKPAVPLPENNSAQKPRP